MHRNPGRIVVALFQGTVVLGIAMIALLWGSITVFLSFERQKAINSAMMNTANLARAFGEHTARTIFGEEQYPGRPSRNAPARSKQLRIN